MNICEHLHKVWNWNKNRQKVSRLLNVWKVRLYIPFLSEVLGISQRTSNTTCLKLTLLISGLPNCRLKTSLILLWLQWKHWTTLNLVNRGTRRHLSHCFTNRIVSPPSLPFPLQVFSHFLFIVYFNWFKTLSCIEPGADVSHTDCWRNERIDGCFVCQNFAKLQQ